MAAAAGTTGTNGSSGGSSGSSLGTGNTSGGTSLGTGNTSSSNSSGATIVNPLNVSTLQDLLGKVLDAFVQLGTIVLTLALIWCGFLFVAARGNEEKIRSARTALMWTIIGGLIILGAKGIQTVITQTVSSITS